MLANVKAKIAFDHYRYSKLCEIPIIAGGTLKGI